MEQNERNGVCVKQGTDKNRKDGNWIHAEKEVEKKRTNEMFIVQKRWEKLSGKKKRKEVEVERSGQVVRVGRRWKRL